MGTNDLDYSHPQGYIPDYSTRGLDRGSPQECVRETHHRIRDLRKKLNNCPNNPENDWAASRSLFEQKEDEADKARAHLEVVQSLLWILEREIDRCRENLKTIEKDRARIRTQATQMYYQVAAGDQMAQYARAVEQYKALREGIATLQSLLSESDRKKLPTRHANAGAETGDDAKGPGTHGKTRDTNRPRQTRWETTKDWLRDNEDRIGEVVEENRKRKMRQEGNI